MKKSISIIIFSLITQLSFSQDLNYNLFDLYIFNYTNVNPAFVGSEGVNKINMSYIGNKYTNAQQISYERRINKINSGLGFIVNKDNLIRNTSLQYSYNFLLKDSSSFRIGANFSYYKIDYNWGIPNVIDKNDPLLNYDLSNNVKTFDLGIWYKRKHLYTGFAGNNIFAKEKITYKSSSIPKNIHFTLGYQNIKLSNSLKLNTSLNIQHNNNYTKTDLNANIELVNRVILGYNFSKAYNDNFYNVYAGIKFLKTNQLLFNVSPINDRFINYEFMLKVLI